MSFTYMEKTAMDKEKLNLLYASGLSMAEMATNFNCSIHKVVYWMDKFSIKRRTWSEASYIKVNRNGDPYSIKLSPNKNEMFLYGAGIGIYLGEGDKRSRHLVRVTNTDPAIIRIFVNFLLRICQLCKSKLLYSIICFNDSDPEEARRYWGNELGVDDLKRFGKIVQIPPQGKGTYKRKSMYGVCTVTVGNVKLKSWIMGEIHKTRERLGKI